MDRPDASHQAGTKEGIPQPQPPKAFTPWDHTDSDSSSIVRHRVPATPGYAPADDADEGFEVAELSDRVVSRLLFDNAVSFRQVAAAWHRWNRRGHTPVGNELWRELAHDPELDAEQVYEIASRVYAFQSVHVGVMGTLLLLQQLERVIRDEQWDALIACGVIPVVEQGQAPGASDRIIFATNDPMRLEIHRLLRTLDCGPFEVRYVPGWIIHTLVAEAFPEKRRLIPGLPSGPAGRAGDASPEAREAVRAPHRHPPALSSASATTAVPDGG